MKKNCLSAVAVFIVLLNVSCEGNPPARNDATPAVRETPSPESETPAVQPDQALLDELGTIMTRAEESRQRAMDFDGASYFPAEWEYAESQYDLSKKMLKNTNDEIKIVQDAYNNVADLYDGVFTRAVPLYAQAREDEIMAIRGELIAEGVRTSYPEYFIPADEEAVLALDQYEAEDYYRAKDTAANALLMYETLKSGYGAWQVRQSIVERDFVQYDPDNFKLAEDSLVGAADTYKAKNIPGARKKTEEALEQYNLVLNAGLPVYAQHHFSTAESERRAALEIKADVSVEDMFARADLVYKDASDRFGSHDYEEAADGFIKAEELFKEAGRATLEKRRRADEAISEAEEEIGKIERNRQTTEPGDFPINRRGGVQ